MMNYKNQYRKKTELYTLLMTRDKGMTYKGELRLLFLTSKLNTDELFHPKTVKYINVFCSKKVPNIFIILS